MALNESGWIYIQLNSGDPSVRSFDNAVSFQNTLPAPITLDGSRSYEVCMIACLFNNNQPLPNVCYYQPNGIQTDGSNNLYSPDPKNVGTCYSVYVNCSLCQTSIVGSQQTNVLCFVPSTAIIQNGCSGDNTHTNQPVFYAPFMARVWQPISEKYIPSISVSFTLSTGSPMPYSTGDFSSIILAVRAVDA
jgi:hypothetical protein